MILVTGGTGLVGSHLLLELLQSNKKIRAIHRKSSDLQHVKKIFSYYLSPEEAEKEFLKIEWQEADILDIPALKATFSGVNTVYHCAALVSFNSSDDRELRKINIEGTANVVNVSLTSGVEKLCHISSIAAVDAAPGEKLVTEGFNWYPEKMHSYYAISKHGAEIEVWRGSQEGLRVVILNPGVILGPGFWNSGTGKLFSKTDKGLKFHFPKTTAFTGVWDVAKTAKLITESGKTNEQYLIVAENRSFREILNQIALNLNKTLPKKELKPWMVYVAWLCQSLMQLLFGKKKVLSAGDHKSLFRHTFYSNEKLKTEFDYEFTPVNEVIKRTAEIFKKEKDRNL